jgi:hypothetical protein
MRSHTTLEYLFFVLSTAEICTLSLPRHYDDWLNCTLRIGDSASLINY